MNILFLITKSEAGGAQTHIWHLSRHLISKGHEVAVMSSSGGWLEGEVKKLGVKFYQNIYLRNSYNIFLGFKAMKEIREAVDEFNPDLISCHSTATGFWGRLAIRNRVLTIFTVHGWGFTEGTPFFRKIILLLAEKIASCYCKKIICVSDFDRELALKYKIAPKEKLITVHNGVEIIDFSKKEINPLEIKIVFVGRLSKQKDPLLLLKAFNLLNQELKEKSEIFIIGEGEKRRELKDFIFKNKLKEKVKLLGELEREEVFEVLRNSDIFVLPSNWEGFPYTILEAMSCGLPVIASDVGGVSEIVDENCGILIERGDKEGLKKALEKLIENSSLLLKLGENAKKRVKEEFSLEKMLKETEELYKLLIIPHDNLNWI